MIVLPSRQIGLLLEMNIDRPAQLDLHGTNVRVPVIPRGKRGLREDCHNHRAFCLELDRRQIFFETVFEKVLFLVLHRKQHVDRPQRDKSHRSVQPQRQELPCYWRWYVQHCGNLTDTSLTQSSSRNWIRSMQVDCATRRRRCYYRRVTKTSRRVSHAFRPLWSESLVPSSRHNRSAIPRKCLS